MQENTVPTSNLWLEALSHLRLEEVQELWQWLRLECAVSPPPVLHFSHCMAWSFG